jgi:hypothetical protein
VYWVWTLGLMLARQALYHLSHSARPFSFVLGIFEIGSCRLFAWLWTVILMISAYWVARIIGVSHWCPAAG